PLHTPVINLVNINILRLDDKTQSLYERIEQARLFAEYVDKAALQIKDRIGILINDINEEAKELTLFPRSLFTLSLQTVANIMDGALQTYNDSDTAKTEGSASSETLLHYLRSLQLNKAAARLRLLAEEAGVNIDNHAQQSFSETTGNILAAYRACKENYIKVTKYMDDLKNRCADAARMLDPLPIDYSESGHAAEVSALSQRLTLIADAFEDLEEMAKVEREKFRDQARKGQFNAILDVPD